METRATVTLAAPAAVVYDAIADLGGYPAWSRIVHSVESAGCGDGDGPAWTVDLRAGVGPLTRSKRLRMVRVVDDRPSRCVLERRELDGRQHSVWRLSCEVLDRGDTAELAMHLHYGGRLWTGGALQRILDQEITDAARRLRSLIESAPTP